MADTDNEKRAREWALGECRSFPGGCRIEALATIADPMDPPCDCVSSLAALLDAAETRGREAALREVAAYLLAQAEEVQWLVERLSFGSSVRERYEARLDALRYASTDIASPGWAARVREGRADRARRAEGRRRP